jgi:alkanesulfonate monooxygenase SsuD/methylene tetrahydromethanopterin reductase-like flavin-dependent oxidoreductase (luciferase family)
MSIRLGLDLPVQKWFNIGFDITEVAMAAEELGYDSLWAGKRVLFPESPADDMYGISGLPWADHYRSNADPLVALTLAASATRRVRLGTIAPSEVGPKPVRRIPVLLAAGTLAAFRRLADRADGWIPVATDPELLAGQWKQLQEVAAERGRTRPISITLILPCQGNPEQAVRDAVHFTEAVPVDELVLSLCSSMTSAPQLIDTIGALRVALRVAAI